MEPQPAPSKISNQLVALVAIFLASSMTFTAFFLSRGDHDLKLMSLTAVLSLGSGLMGIAGTLLVGVQAYRSLIAGDLPPSSLPKPAEHQETEPKPQ